MTATLPARRWGEWHSERVSAIAAEHLARRIICTSLCAVIRQHGIAIAAEAFRVGIFRSAFCAAHCDYLPAGRWAKYRDWTGQLLDANLHGGSRRAKCRHDQIDQTIAVWRTTLGTQLRVAQASETERQTTPAPMRREQRLAQF